MTITYEWRGDFGNASLDALHADGFGPPVTPAAFYFDACGFRETAAGLIAL
ncbi:hypothetical protein ACWF9B_07765 [Streptomyces sp. NPDC055089]